MKNRVLAITLLSLSTHNLFAAEADPVSKVNLALRFGTGALNDLITANKDDVPLDRICFQLGRVTAIMRRTEGSNPEPPKAVTAKAIQYENFCRYKKDPNNTIPPQAFGLMAQNLYADLSLFQDFVNKNSNSPTPVVAVPQAPAAAAANAPTPELDTEEKEMLDKLKSVLKLASGVQNTANATGEDYQVDSMCMQIGRITAIIRRSGKSSLIAKAFAKSAKDYNQVAVLNTFKIKATSYEAFCSYVTSENQKTLSELTENEKIPQAYFSTAKKKVTDATDANASKKIADNAIAILKEHLEADAKNLEEAIVKPLTE